MMKDFLIKLFNDPAFQSNILIFSLLFFVEFMLLLSIFI